MAIHPSSDASGWARWNQYRTNTDDADMNHRAMAASPAGQRPIMAPQYIQGPSYSVPPVSTLPSGGSAGEMPMDYAPQYPSMPRTSLAETFHNMALRQPPALPSSRGSLPAVTPASRRPSLPRPSPSVISSRTDPAQEIPASAINAKTIDPIISTNPPKVKTAVDELMTVIKPEIVEELLKDENYKYVRRSPSPGHRVNKTAQAGPPKEKKHRCPDCGKMFAQKSHMTNHRHIHQGYLPFICQWCGKRDTQKGNHEAHERRHTGEKPFRCDYVDCNKAFVSRGGLSAHKKTHLKEKPFRCILDGCTKDFSALNNMKNHVAKFHAKTVGELKLRFASVTPNDAANMDPTEKKIYLFVSVCFKNCNKGIKGRGKQVKAVFPVNTEQTRPGYSVSGDSSASSPASTVDYSHMPPTPVMPHQLPPMVAHHTADFSCTMPMPIPAYSPMPHHLQQFRPMHGMPVPQTLRHDMYGMPEGLPHQQPSQFNMSSPVVFSPTSPSVYDDEQIQCDNELSFSDRMH